MWLSFTYNVRHISEHQKKNYSKNRGKIPNVMENLKQSQNEVDICLFTTRNEVRRRHWLATVWLEEDTCKKDTCNTKYLTHLQEIRALHQTLEQNAFKPCLYIRLDYS
jgi:2-phosphoglycerate kinase